jgi:hypothetical protein
MKAATFALVMPALLLAAPPAASAQGGRQPVTWTLALEPAAATYRQASTLTAVVAATIDAPWHVYAADELPDGPRPLRIDLVAGGPASTAGPTAAPEPEREYDDAFKQVTAFYRESATFRVPLVITPTARPGALAIVIDIAFQACDGRMCLPGRTVRLSLPVAIARAPKPGR